MVSLIPQAFVGSAQSLLGFGEESPSKRGRFVDSILRQAGRPMHEQWDLAFIHHVGWWSQRAPSGTYSVWPFPRHATHRDLAAIAAERHLIRTSPEPGDIVLYWSDDLRQYVRSAIIVMAALESLDPTATPRYVCRTIEGNLTERGDYGGMYVREMDRTLAPSQGDLFIRWAMLDSRNALGDPSMDLYLEAGRPKLAAADPGRAA
ncbi:MAG TPA: hypothetical protein VMH39_02305 [Gemmatimonadaceae bacterium]|nr:hypothetical protein [Gemmatimonadaceae bacterium]